MDSSDSFANLGVVAPVALGLIYCVREWGVIAKVRLDGQKDDGCLDRALLEHRASQIEGVKHIAGLIAAGADSFLIAQYRYLAVFIVVFSGVVGVAAGCCASVAFVTGCITSILAGYIGMKIATFSNSRTTHECWRSLTDGHNLAMRGGCIASFALVCIGLCNFFLLIVAFKAIGGWRGNEMWMALAGYSFGVSSIALFSRVGGGIYTKAADIGADLSGKMDFGLSEDDYRNPACIADNVGDNVGGVVGKGADLFSSLAGATCAALVIAGSSGDMHCSPSRGIEGISGDWPAMMFPMLIPASSIVVNILTVMAVGHFEVKEVKDVERALKRLIVVSTALETPVVYCLAWLCLPPVFTISCDLRDVGPMHCVVATWLGLWAGLVIAHVTEYYTSYRYSPVQQIASAHGVSAASGIISGLAVGYLSCVVPVFCLAITVLVAQTLVGPYGIALAALGMLSNMPLCLAIDAYDSIADNARGIAEMSGLITDATDVLGTAGATGNGFTISVAALVSLALLGTFSHLVGTGNAEMGDRWYFTGLLLGAMLPYTFSGIVMRSVNKAATDMVEECRRQFPQIINRYEKPDYDRCIKISTKASLKDLGPAGLLVIGAPVAAGVLLGKKCTGGLLQGALVSGVQMAISMINTGGAWDNAKKYIALSGGKDTEQHNNAIIGDLVGDPLKDVSGPSLNVLMNLSAITSIIFCSLISRCSGADGGPAWMEGW